MINIDYLLQLHLIGKKRTNQEPPIQIGKIYGVEIDTLNANSNSSVKYTDDAIGFNPALGNNGNFSYASWEDRFPFNEIKPCIVKGGVVQYYLNPDDYSKKLDGSNSNIQSGLYGDVMVEFPTIYWKIELLGTKLYVKYSDVQVDSSYQALAHQKGTRILDKIYIGAYLNTNSTIFTADKANKLISISGQPPLTNVELATLRTRASDNYSEYEVLGYYQLLMLQVLYVVMFKNLDSQQALGNGIVDASVTRNTGHLNDKGLFYGTTKYTDGVKFCGIEDFYGNFGVYIDGIVIGADRNIKIGIDNFNNSFIGYVNQGQITNSYQSGYIKSVKGTTNLGFIMNDTSSSNSGYYSDYVIISESSVPVFGAKGSSTQESGAFSLVIDYSVNFRRNNIGSRIMCRI